LHFGGVTKIIGSADNNIEMPKVKFHNNGEETEVEAGSLLHEGWPIAYGCEDGVCGTCIIRIDKGKTALGPIEAKEEQTLDMMGMNDGDHRLSCQCHVNGDVEIEGF
jgi:ferredoxin